MACSRTGCEVYNPSADEKSRGLCAALYLHDGIEDRGRTHNSWVTKREVEAVCE